MGVVASWAEQPPSSLEGSPLEPQAPPSRHLTISQRAALAVQILPMLEADARE
jgi:hypothetical protein